MLFRVLACFFGDFLSDGLLARNSVGLGLGTLAFVFGFQLGLYAGGFLSVLARTLCCGCGFRFRFGFGIRFRLCVSFRLRLRGSSGLCAHLGFDSGALGGEGSGFGVRLFPRPVVGPLVFGGTGRRRPRLGSKIYRGLGDRSPCRFLRRDDERLRKVEFLTGIRAAGSLGRCGGRFGWRRACCGFCSRCRGRGHLAHKSVFLQLLQQLEKFRRVDLLELLVDLRDPGFAVDLGEHCAIGARQEARLAGSLQHAFASLGKDRGAVHCYSGRHEKALQCPLQIPPRIQLYMAAGGEWDVKSGAPRSPPRPATL